MADNPVARASIVIDAPSSAVWQALIDPDLIQEYMFGATVTTDWRTGSPITWSGEADGEPYRDKGFVLKVDPGRVLEYNRYSPLSGLPDAPEHYHVVRIELESEGAATRVNLEESNIASHEVWVHSEANWTQILEGLKDVVERRPGREVR